MVAVIYMEDTGASENFSHLLGITQPLGSTIKPQLLTLGLVLL